jgi:hypothetical protein
MTLGCVVDAGFAGGLQTFGSLGRQAYLLPEVYLVVTPDSRRVTLATASREVKAGSSRMRCLVHAAPTIDRKVVGRAFLRSFVITLDGQVETLSLSEHPPVDIRNDFRHPSPSLRIMGEL